jgi:hypothetical protein
MRPSAAPILYFPVRDVYDTKPNLHRLDADFGNGAFDRKIFQMDSRFPDYRKSKLSARRERLGGHHLLSGYGGAVERAVTDCVLRRLTEEYPGHFALRNEGNERALECRLTGETLAFGREGELVPSRSAMHAGPPYTSSLDALACQVQEDMAVITMDGEDEGNRVTAIHACSPNHWAPEEKIGGDFFEIHNPIPDMDSTNKAQKFIVQAMVTRGPYVRFAWGLATDTRLNHHPRPPAGAEEALWKGRNFEEDGPLYLRVERQTTNPLPEARSSLFTIRTSFLDCRDVRRDPAKREKLVHALRSMSPASLAYKGMSGSRERIIAWLEGK